MAEGAGRVFTLDADSLAPAGPTIQTDSDLHGHGSQSGQPDGTRCQYDFVFVDLDQGHELRRGKIDFAHFLGDMASSRLTAAALPSCRADAVRAWTSPPHDWLGPPVPAHVQSISYAPDGSTFATGWGRRRVVVDGNTGSLLGMSCRAP